MICPQKRAFELPYGFSVFQTLKKNVGSLSNKKKRWSCLGKPMHMRSQGLLAMHLIRNRQFKTTLGSSSCQNLPPVFRTHSGSKSMFIHSFSLRRLKCSLHYIRFSLSFLKKRGKGTLNHFTRQPIFRKF